MEHLLHYVWKHRLFPLKEMVTTDGERVEVIDTGLHNTNTSGADFFNAKVKIDGKMWVGNVEIHTRSSDWYRHNHDKDEAYNNVVLHVVENKDEEVVRQNGERVPQLILPCPENVRQNYKELCYSDTYPCCHRVVPNIPRIKVTSWISTLQTERLGKKAKEILERLEKRAGDWEETFFISLARNFGFGINSDAFELWAKHIPYSAVAKHRDNLMQIEAIFFGVAGMLKEEKTTDSGYYESLRKEYLYLKHKFGIEKEVDNSIWKFMRLRPDNFPTIRIAQLAYLFHKNNHLFNKAIAISNIAQVSELIKTSTSDFWKTHYTFDGKANDKTTEKRLSRNSIDLIGINTISPFIYAYALHRGDEEMATKATDLLESIKPEDNHIIRSWINAQISIETAADTQAIIQLQKEYCNKRKCLRCMFGYEYLKSENKVREEFV